MFDIPRCFNINTITFSQDKTCFQIEDQVLYEKSKRSLEYAVFWQKVQRGEATDPKSDGVRCLYRQLSSKFCIEVP